MVPSNSTVSSELTISREIGAVEFEEASRLRSTSETNCRGVTDTRTSASDFTKISIGVGDHTARPILRVYLHRVVYRERVELVQNVLCERSLPGGIESALQVGNLVGTD